jgi:hypothetical protein
MCLLPRLFSVTAYRSVAIVVKKTVRTASVSVGPQRRRGSNRRTHNPLHPHQKAESRESLTPLDGVGVVCGDYRQLVCAYFSSRHGAPLGMIPQLNGALFHREVEKALKAAFAPHVNTTKNIICGCTHPTKRLSVARTRRSQIADDRCRNCSRQSR